MMKVSIVNSTFSLEIHFPSQLFQTNTHFLIILNLNSIYGIKGGVNGGGTMCYNEWRGNLARVLIKEALRSAVNRKNQDGEQTSSEVCHSSWLLCEKSSAEIIKFF